MEIKGEVINVSEIQSGVSANGKEWSKQDFTIKFGSDRYPEHLTVTAFPADKAKGVTIGCLVTCGVAFESKEYKGKWYNSVSAYKIEITKQGEMNFNKPFVPGNEPKETEDLPF